MLFWTGVLILAFLFWLELRRVAKFTRLIEDLEMYRTQMAGLLRMDDATINEIAAKQKQIDDCKRELRKLGYDIDDITLDK